MGQEANHPSGCALGMGLDRGDQRMRRDHHLHPRKQPFPFGLRLGCGELIIRVARLLAGHYPSAGLRSRKLYPADAMGTPDTP